MLALSHCGYSYRLHGRTIPELLQPHPSFEPSNHSLNSHCNQSPRNSRAGGLHGGETIIGEFWKYIRHIVSSGRWEKEHTDNILSQSRDVSFPVI